MSNECKVLKNCRFCELFICQPIGDGDLGPTHFEKEPSCSLEKDIDNDSEVLIKDFDREVERDCCKLDIWLVAKVDTEVSDLIDKNMLESFDISEAYEFFLKKYYQ